MANKRNKNPSKYSDLLKVMSKNIKYYRKNVLNLTQEDMMELGFDRRYFQKLESGRYSPSLQTLARVADVLDVSVVDLLSDSSSLANKKAK